MIDFHSHLMPGVDDGAATLDESRAALQAFADQGFSQVVTTPHFRASEIGQPGTSEFFARLEQAWGELTSLAPEFPGLTLGRGLEVNLDTPAPLFDDPRLRLSGSSAVLIEFPFFSVPPNAVPALFEVRMSGWMPVLAHPERYANLPEDLELVRELRRVGVFLQLNAGSLLGRYGARERRVAWALLREGLADFVASDYHARGTLHTLAARDAVLSAGGEEQAALLFETNAARVLAGELPVAVPPLQPRRPSWRHWLRTRIPPFKAAGP
jgi:protein-tyrosine phosphatase